MIDLWYFLPPSIVIDLNWIKTKPKEELYLFEVPQKPFWMFQVELHQTKLAVEQTEARLVQVTAEAKQKQDQLQELKCKVRVRI